MGIREIFIEMLEQYQQEYEKDNKVSSSYYRNLKQRIEQTFKPICRKFGLRIKALGGQGVMRKNPYICFLAEGHRTNKGIYPNYHFDLERQIVSVGIGDANEHSPSTELSVKLSTYATELLPEFPLKDKDGYPEKEYSKSGLSNMDEETLLEDLTHVVEVHQRCLEGFDEEIQKYLQGNDTKEFQNTNIRMKGDQKSQEMMKLIRKHYPGWNNFSHSDFVKDEIDYKRVTINKAAELLNQTELERLLHEQQWDEFLNRLEKIGKDNNLLFLSVPMSGDLNILYQEHLNKPAFCQEVYQLLYGTEASEVRLEQYLNYVKTNNLPNKWTFPTYLLFVCHPDSEMFIKPMTTKWFVRLAGDMTQFSSEPSSASYQYIRELCVQLKRRLQIYHPTDMVDIQGFIWACFWINKTMLLKPDKHAEFLSLFQEFIESAYFETPDGQDHKTFYAKARQEARHNVDEIAAKAEQGEDITEPVLKKCITYANTEHNQQSGAWIHIAPTISKDIRVKFEGAGWTKPEDWPSVARLLWNFVTSCLEHPAKLADACATFFESPFSKGFQTGMLTPILNALRPDDFILINNKSRAVINYLTGNSYKQHLNDYPDINRTAWNLIEEISEEMHQFEIPEMRDDDLFDVFCHWLVAVKKYDFKDSRYWKIAPGEQARKWEECRDNGFIAIGWDELGDVSQLSRAEFKKKRDELVAQYPDWKKGGVDQVWKFYRIKEGDRVVANRGTTEVLGIGTVTGLYYFVSGVEYGHRLPVEWDDVTPRQIEEYGWRRTLIELGRDKFETILHAPSITQDDDFTQNTMTLSEKRQSEEFIESAFQQHYPNSDERKICATLLADSILHAERENQSCWGVTLRDNNLIRLNVGKVEVLRLHKERIYLVVDASLLDMRMKEQFQNIIEFSDSYYLSVSGEQGYGWIPSNQLSSILDKLKPAYFALIEHAAQTVVTQSPYHESHSPGILKYLRRFLQRDLPDPAYSKIEEKPLYVREQPHSLQYWWLNANPKIWNFESLAVGAKDFYTSHNERGNKRQLYTAFEQVQPGDFIIGYVTSPARKITAICRITQGLHTREQGDVIEFEKLEQLPHPVNFDELKSISELQHCRPIINNQGSLFPLTVEEYDIIRSVIDEQNISTDFVLQDEYSLEQCTQESGFRLETLQTWKRAIERKKQAILYGPPGTGKTFIAEQLARHLIGGDDGFMDIVQFHPAYSYEDFIQGIRPKARDDGGLDYPTVDGRFLEFCRQAQGRGTCVLIIDEINRANLARVFGELMFLLEYREKGVALASGERFRIPENVRIIGTMNTADRSIALVDYALRRRFAFFALRPDYEVLRKYHERKQTGFPIAGLLSVLKEVNRQIADSYYEVGISFFLREQLSEELEDIWQMEIEPYLEEYFFDQPAKVEDFRWETIQAKVLPS